MSSGQRSQNQHLIRINSILGDDVLLVRQLNASLLMSALSRFSLQVYSDNQHDISAKALVGTPVTLCVMNEEGLPSYYNSYVTAFKYLGPSATGESTEYMLELQPWLHFLNHDSDCRIFQEMTVVDVIHQVFEAYGSVANYVIKLSSHYPKKRFWVQYNETNLNFFHRICRDEGIAYFFSFDNGQHTLHITDAETPPLSLSPKVVEYQAHTKARDHINHWEAAGKFTTGTFEHRTYHYKTPRSSIVGQAEVVGNLAQTPRVMETHQYRYVSDYSNAGEMSDSAMACIRKITEASNTVSGRGDCRYLKIGHCFSVLPVPASSFFPDRDKEFTLVELMVNADNHGQYEANFVGLPKGELCYPQAQDVVIPGTQTAVVTGPKGEELYMDPQGRIKVQFHWDRLGKGNENTTCWLRVMQSFAGPNFGAQFTPRIGQEVVVSFEDGNPSRPFVIGALYHPENPPPYAKYKGSRNGIRTRSTKGGKTDQCNELYFEDKKGGEEVYFQAQKDHNLLIKHDQNSRIENNKHHQVVNNETNDIGENLKIMVGNQTLINSGSKITLQVGGSTITMSGSKIDISSGTVNINGKINLN